jgi:hypothetical protein
MIDPINFPVNEAVMVAEDWVPRARVLIDRNPHIPHVAHIELDAALEKFYRDVARGLGIA